VSVDKLSVLMHYLRVLAGSPRDGEPDVRLLQSFVREQDEQAFAVLLRRYGPLVWQTCRRVAGHEQDAEDVFQATFLLLARKASTIRKSNALGSWLFGVAHRLALRAKTNAARRRRHEEQMVAAPFTQDPAAGLTWRELRVILDEELARLPDKYRAPLLLCYYEGLTQDEAAKRLGWTARAVKDRLERGRNRLDARLTRRGLTLSAALAGSMLASGASAAPVPAALAAATLRTAILFRLGEPVARAASANALLLAKGALKAIFLTKLGTVAGSLLVVAAIGGAGLTVGNVGRESASPAAMVIPRVSVRVEPAAIPIQQAQKPQLDLWGDPLPAGALARLGTVRFRTGGGYGFGALGFLADNKTVVSVTHEGQSVGLWEAATGKLLREIRTEYPFTVSFALSPDSRYFAAQGWFPPDRDDKTPRRAAIDIWETASGKKLRSIEPIGDNLEHFSVLFLPGGKLLVLESSVTAGKSLLRIEEVATAENPEHLPFPHRVGGNPAVSSDGSMLVLGSAPNRDKFYLWKWQISEEPREIKTPLFDGRPDYFGKYLAFSPDGRIVVESFDTLHLGVRVWDLANGKLLHKLEPPETEGLASKAAVFSPDGKMLIASFRSNTTGSVHIWETATWKHLKRWELADREGDGKLAVSPDSKMLAVRGESWFRVWDLASGKEMSPNDEAHLGAVNRIVVDGSRVATAADDHTVRLWDAATGRQHLKLDHGSWVRALALSPNGAKLASSSLDDSVCLWDSVTGERLFKLPGHGAFGGARALAFTPDGKELLSWSDDDMRLCKWNITTGKPVHEHVLHPKDAKPTEHGRLLGTFSLDAKTLVLAMQTHFHVFDVATGKDLYQIPNEGGSVVSQAISPDSRLFLASAWSKPTLTKLPNGNMQSSSGRNHPISLWELSTRQLRKQVMLPDGGAGPVAISPDNRFFAAALGEPDRRIRIWDMANGNEIAAIQGFRGSVTALAFTPDGERLISGMDDTTVLLWDLKSKH
jgi:RNA polymerase sigma factor (sigma-70 family)